MRSAMRRPRASTYPSTKRSAAARGLVHCAPHPCTLRFAAIFLRRRDRPISLRPAVAIELPRIPDFANEVEVEVGDDDVVDITRPFRQDLAARVAEITLAVEFADAPRLFPTRTV